MLCKTANSYAESSPLCHVSSWLLSIKDITKQSMQRKKELVSNHKVLVLKEPGMVEILVKSVYLLCICHTHLVNRLAQSSLISKLNTPLAQQSRFQES